MLAFSYIRWSSTQQTSGDSLRRQTDLAAKYAAENNLTLDNTSFQDHGVSAFKGKNVLEGKLGTFLQAIDEGSIQTPCYLLVEALDRITRSEIADATQLFLSIIQRNVKIVVLQSEQVFSKETISADNGISLIIAISMLVQGYTDSAKRGKRVVEAWDQKRKNGGRRDRLTPLSIMVRCLRR
jgi:DNA invertase Pin-like site-specific DNA recombinase